MSNLPLDKTNLEHASQRILSGDAWNDFCDELKVAGQLLSQDGCPQDAFNRMLGYRALTHWLRAGLEMGLDYSHPEFPAFYRLADETKKMGNDNPDNIYFNCVIDAASDYRIYGNRGTVNWFSVNSKGSATSIAGMSNTGSIDSSQMRFEDNGDFEIFVSATAKEKNWLPLETGSQQLIVRQTFGDRGNEQAASMDIECLNARAENNTPALQNFEPSLQRALTFIKSTTQWTNDWMAVFASHINQLPDDDQLRCISSGGDPDIRYYQSRWKLAADEALLIHLRDIPACQTWNFQLSNAWMESLDYRFFTVSVNKYTAHYEADGSVLIVVANSDPGPDYPNWLNTCDHFEGGMLGRLVKSQIFPSEFPAKVVKLSSL